MIAVRCPSGQTFYNLDFLVITLESHKNGESSWNTNKGKKNKKKLDFSSMPLEEKRSYYRCGDFYVTFDQIQPWPDYVKDSHYFFTRKGNIILDCSKLTPLY